MRQIFYLHDDIKSYLERVKINKRKDSVKLNDLIQKLMENGSSSLIINGRNYKKIKTGNKSKLPIIQIKIITKHYRVHTALTQNYLYLVHAFDKKRNKTSEKDISLSIQRINTITNF